jgi:hypothetical protein
MNRFQFSWRALLILMLSVACFFGGVHYERERRGREEELAAQAAAAARPTKPGPKRGKIEDTFDKFDYPLNGALRD